MSELREFEAGQAWGSVTFWIMIVQYFFKNYSYGFIL